MERPLNRILKKGWLLELRNWLFIIAGVMVAVVGIKGFLLNRGLVDGGVTGIALLISRISGWPIYVLVLLINLPFSLLGKVMVSRLFALRSMVAVILLSIGLAFIEIPLVTKDVWLISVFGGFFTGAGMGLVMRGEAVIDGRELLSMYLSRRHLFSASDISLIINIGIFSVAALMLDIETALYSVLTYFSTANTISYITEGIEEYLTVNIVSEKHEEIRDAIIEKLGRGVTIYHGQMGFGKRGKSSRETEIINTVITRLELPKLQHEIEKIDPDAFITAGIARDSRGGMIKKRSLKVTR